MAGESFVQVAPDSSGKKLHTNNRTIGANSVEDEYVIPGELPGPAYTVKGASVAGATTGDDLIQIMAGASNPVRIRRIRVYQRVLITTANEFSWDAIRITSAGTGGTAVTPRPMNTGSAAAGATAAQGVPNATHGTAGVTLWTGRLWAIQTVGAGGSPGPGPMDEWVQSPNSEPMTIPAGIANGIALRVSTGRAGITCDVLVEFVELTY